MKLFKKNQVIIYVIALMIMTAGYLNYTTNTGSQSLETSMQIESKDDMHIADIGDATLVYSNDVISESAIDTNSNMEKDNANNEKLNGLEDKNGAVNNFEEKNNDIKEEVKNEVNNINNEVENQNTVNYIEEKNKNNDNTTVQTSSLNNSNKTEYFVKSKLERDTMYSQMIETYEKVLNSSNSLEMQKQTATQEIQKINDTKNSIMISENLLKTKGFEDNIIFVNGESVSVIIGKDELKQEEIAQIQNIISREMKAQIENIHIATKFN